MDFEEFVCRFRGNSSMTLSFLRYYLSISSCSRNLWNSMIWLWELNFLAMLTRGLGSTPQGKSHVNIFFTEQISALARVKSTWVSVYFCPPFPFQWLPIVVLHILFRVYNYYLMNMSSIKATVNGARTLVGFFFLHRKYYSTKIVLVLGKGWNSSKRGKKKITEPPV